MKKEENSIIYSLSGEIIEFDEDRVIVVGGQKKDKQDDLLIEDLAEDIRDFITKIGDGKQIELKFSLKEVK